MMYFEDLVLVLHVLAALAIIGVVMLQHGKGADMGAGFGSGASATVFGAVGSGNFLTRTTTIAALVFFITSFSLAYFAKERAVQAANVGFPIPTVQESVTESDAVSAMPAPGDEMPMPAEGSAGAQGADNVDELPQTE